MACYSRKNSEENKVIDKFDLAKALRNKSDLVATANNYVLVGHGERFETSVDDTHIEEMVLYGDDNPVGLSDDSSDMQIGIYQLSVHTPKSSTKWAGLAIIRVLQTAFFKGLTLGFNSQDVRVKSNSLSPMMQSDAYLIHHLSIIFTVVN